MDEEEEVDSLSSSSLSSSSITEERLKTQFTRLKAEYRKLKEEHDKLTDLHTKAISDKDAEIRRLKSQMDDTDQELENEVQSLIGDNIEKAAEISRLKFVIAGSNDNGAGETPAFESTNRLVTELTERTNEINQLKRELEGKNLELDRMKYNIVVHNDRVAASQGVDGKKKKGWFGFGKKPKKSSASQPGFIELDDVPLSATHLGASGVHSITPTHPNTINSSRNSPIQRENFTTTRRDSRREPSPSVFESLLAASESTSSIQQVADAKASDKVIIHDGMTPILKERSIQLRMTKEALAQAENKNTELQLQIQDLEKRMDQYRLAAQEMSQLWDRKIKEKKEGEHYLGALSEIVAANEKLQERLFLESQTHRDAEKIMQGEIRTLRQGRVAQIKGDPPYTRVFPSSPDRVITVFRQDAYPPPPIIVEQVTPSPRNLKLSPTHRNANVEPADLSTESSCNPDPPAEPGNEFYYEWFNGSYQLRQGHNPVEQKADDNLDDLSEARTVADQALRHWNANPPERKSSPPSNMTARYYKRHEDVIPLRRRRYLSVPPPVKPAVNTPKFEPVKEEKPAFSPVSLVSPPTADVVADVTDMPTPPARFSRSEEVHRIVEKASPVVLRPRTAPRLVDACAPAKSQVNGTPQLAAKTPTIPPKIPPAAEIPLAPSIPEKSALDNAFGKRFSSASSLSDSESLESGEPSYVVKDSDMRQLVADSDDDARLLL